MLALRKTDMRVLMISSGALFLVSTGAFFLYVPPLSIATAVLFLVGLTLMFGLGFQAGGQGMVPCRDEIRGVVARNQPSMISAVLLERHSDLRDHEILRGNRDELAYAAHLTPKH